MITALDATEKIKEEDGRTKKSDPLFHNNHPRNPVPIH